MHFSGVSGALYLLALTDTSFHVVFLIPFCFPLCVVDEVIVSDWRIHVHEKEFPFKVHLFTKRRVAAMFYGLNTV